MRPSFTVLLRPAQLLALALLPSACLSLEDYPLPPRLAGRMVGDTYLAPGGGWSIEAPTPPATGGRPVASVADSARNARQTTLLVVHEAQGLEWSVDVLDPRVPGEPALEADFMVGFFAWLATCDDRGDVGAREVRDDREDTLDGKWARWVRAEPLATAAAGERACLAVLVRREPYWVACLVKYRADGAPAEAELHARLTELVRSFRVTAP